MNGLKGDGERVDDGFKSTDSFCRTEENKDKEDDWDKRVSNALIAW